MGHVVQLKGKVVRAKQMPRKRLAVIAVAAESPEIYVVERRRGEILETCVAEKRKGEIRGTCAPEKKKNETAETSAAERKRAKKTPETNAVEKKTRETLDAQHRRRGNCLRLGRRKRVPPRVGPPLACPQLLVALSRASNTYACSGQDRGMPSVKRSKETLEACDDTFLSLTFSLDKS